MDRERERERSRAERRLSRDSKNIKLFHLSGSSRFARRSVRDHIRLPFFPCNRDATWSDGARGGGRNVKKCSRERTVRHGEPQRYVPKETGLKLPLRFCLIIKRTASWKAAGVTRWMMIRTTFPSRVKSFRKKKRFFPSLFSFFFFTWLGPNLIPPYRDRALKATQWQG